MPTLSDQTKILRALDFGMLAGFPTSHVTVLRWLANNRVRYSDDTHVYEAYVWKTGGTGYHGQPINVRQDTWAVMMGLKPRTLRWTLRSLREDWKFIYKIGDEGRNGHLVAEHGLTRQFIDEAVDWYDYVWTKARERDASDYPGLTSLYIQAAKDDYPLATTTWRDLVSDYYPDRLKGTSL